MKEIAEIGNTFATFGFSAVMCFVIFNQYTVMQKQHADESKQIADAINELKLAIKELIVKIDTFKDNIEKEISK